MGRVLLKCAYCGAFFATGLNVAAGKDPRKLHKFDGLPYRCTECGEERDYSAKDLVDEGARVGGKGRERGDAPQPPPPQPQRAPKPPKKQ